MPTWLVVLAWLAQPAITAALLSAYFSRRLESYKSEFNLALGRASRFDEKAFTVSAEIWGKMVASFWSLTSLRAQAALWDASEELRLRGTLWQDTINIRSKASAIRQEVSEMLLANDVFLPSDLAEHFRELEQSMSKAEQLLANATTAFELEGDKLVPAPYSPEKC